ncbi:S8 family serine peptidase [Pontibacter sp. BAB1700]|uniref:S8 family serine peptidase n=1 Tax=Pontibacter sp. BAB1700 TaxID=1144253 RepID=UPI0002DCDFF7
MTQHALIAHSSFEELFPDKSETLLTQGISVQNHSYGVGVENYYGLEAQAYDQQSYQHPELLHVFSSGNSGDKSETSGTYANLPGIANLTGQFKTSKNTLSVGALDPDGR